MAEESGEEEPKKRPAPPPVEFLKPGETQGPLPPRDQLPAAWVPRPEEYQRPTSWIPPTSSAPRAPSNLPKIAGVLLIVSAVVGMAGAIYQAVALPSVAEYTNFTQRNSPTTVALLQICGLISIWSQGLAFLRGAPHLDRPDHRPLSGRVGRLQEIPRVGEALDGVRHDLRGPLPQPVHSDLEDDVQARTRRMHGRIRRRPELEPAGTFVELEHLRGEIEHAGVSEPTSDRRPKRLRQGLPDKEERDPGPP